MQLSSGGGAETAKPDVVKRYMVKSTLIPKTLLQHGFGYLKYIV
jgi:hypothetical protein